MHRLLSPVARREALAHLFLPFLSHNREANPTRLRDISTEAQDPGAEIGDWGIHGPDTLDTAETHIPLPLIRIGWGPHGCTRAVGSPLSGAGYPARTHPFLPSHLRTFTGLADAHPSLIVDHSPTPIN